MHTAIKQIEKNASRDSCPCCSYGNKKQQQINAKRLAKIIDI